MSRRARTSSRASRPTPAVVVLTAAACLVAGCTGGQEPTPSPPSATAVEPAPAPSPTPTTDAPVKPERPAAMDTDDAAGAAAAAEYYVELSGYALAAVDGSELGAMSHSTCGYCSETMEQVAWLDSSDGSYIGGQMDASVEDPAKYVRDQQTGIYPLDMTVTQEALTVNDGDGAEVASEPASTATVRVEVGRTDGNWVVVEIAPVPEG